MQVSEQTNKLTKSDYEFYSNNRIKNPCMNKDGTMCKDKKEFCQDTCIKLLMLKMERIDQKNFIKSQREKDMAGFSTKTLKQRSKSRGRK